MIVTPILSQRNSAWAWKTLGFSTGTIGDYGCLITCLTMLLGRVDVSLTNDILKKMGNYNYSVNPNGAYLNNLIVWGNVPKAFPEMTFIKRGWVYNNTEVSDWVYNKKIPVIVQVDAEPIGAPRLDHFVLYVGDKKLVDPWTGRIRPTSDFPITLGYALYQTDLFSEKLTKLKIGIDRLKNEFDSDLSNPNTNKETLYNATMTKVKKIYDTGTL